MSFVAVDWGSTHFRAYWVEEQGEVERLSGASGLSSTPPEELANALVTQLAPWRARIESGRVPVLMAGMIGSNRGLRDAGYQRLPVYLDELAAENAQLEVQTPLSTRVSVRPGLALADGDAFDVMRGEEVQLLGAAQLLPANLYVMPGTHSKWVPVEDAGGRARVSSFSTMMTGELYAWLVQQSVVCRGVPQGSFGNDAFLRGVDCALSGGDVLEQIFRTRARWLLGNLAPEAAPSHLSGLLIGHELATMVARFAVAGPLVIVGATQLCSLYERAAARLSLSVRVLDEQAAVVAGFRRLHHGR